MILSEIIEGLSIIRVSGDTGQEIQSVTFDSREVKTGSLYIAVKGTAVDGHQYISQAIEKGAAAIVCEEIPQIQDGEGTYIQTTDERKAIALLASAWYGHPSREIRLVGVTGTNGKTTIATLLYKVNTGLGYKAGILTTIEVIINGKSYPASHTTPDALQINRWLREMVNAGCEYCFMEVSSHAASQKRIAGLQFNGGIFSNLTHDHLDYHKDFREYLEDKRSFFDQLDEHAFALSNRDDRNGEVMLQHTGAGKYYYSLRSNTGFHARILESHFEGMRMEIDRNELWVKLTGRFNAYNLLAVYATCILLGHKEMEVLEQLSNAGPAAGRFEVYKGSSGTLAVIDYAHTDDALRNVLETIQEVNREGREIITIVGAGGDRDRSKRPKMGAVAAGLSQKVILTSDNPRSEDPEAIIAEMAKGMDPGHKADVLKITDREEAIKTACLLAGKGSVILLAGKGHETYQEIKGEKRHFDDREVMLKYLK